MGLTLITLSQLFSYIDPSSSTFVLQSVSVRTVSSTQDVIIVSVTETVLLAELGSVYPRV